MKVIRFTACNDDFTVCNDAWRSAAALPFRTGL